MNWVLIKILGLCAIIMAFTLPPKKKTRVFLVGDSTMCSYEISRAPLTGWGMPFVHFFDSSVIIENRAKGGRSTRTFLSEKHWQSVVSMLKTGDYVLIQFGHNDEAKEEKYKDRFTPVNDYKINLTKFIKDTRARKAFPVLLTPVSRMKFDKQGIAQETHKDYSAAVWEVGKLLKVPVIDLDKMSRDLFQKFGPEYSKLLFMHLEPGEHPNYPDGLNDNTHFNEFGARKIAELVLSGIRQLNLPLYKSIVQPVKK